MTHVTPKGHILVTVGILTSWMAFFDLFIFILILLLFQSKDPSLLSDLPQQNFVFLVNMLDLDLDSSHFDDVILL